MHRIVVDTNLWISLLLTKDFKKFDSILFGTSALLLFSEELLLEFVTVAQRPKFTRYFTLTDLYELVGSIRLKASFIAVTSTVEPVGTKKTISFLHLLRTEKPHTCSLATRIYWL